MPRNLTSVSIFLSSPGDVSQERALVTTAIDEWNGRMSRDRGIFFDLIKFETSVSAGFGDDGQGVINEQVADDYDVLIAIFWKRLGSETARASSGSVEEFQRALSRYKNGEKIEISFLFKTTPVDVRDPSSSQIN